jgi:RNA polymerase sigma-70 factor (ECF subfamily)
VFDYFKNINLTNSDEELMKALSGGNRRAFEIIYDRYFQRLVYFNKGLLNSNEIIAEDIAQDVFIKIIQQPKLFDTDKKFSTWIFTISKNLCFNHLRNEKNRKDLLQNNFQAESIMHHYSSIDAEIVRKKIAQVFETLNDKEKAIFVLRFEQELPLKEIAEIVEIPEGSVKSGIFYLLKKISSQLKDYSHVN